MSKPRYSFTIRQRLIVLNITVFVFICLLIVSYLLQFVAIEKSLFMLEDFHDLFDNVLEVRRYEKNFLLDVGAGNITSVLDYLDKIETDIKRQEENIIKVVGRRHLRDFRTVMDGYRSIFAAFSVTSNQAIDAHAIREKGKTMEAFIRKLLDDQQQKIRTRFKVTIVSFVSVTGAFFLFTIVGLHLQAKSVLDRIGFVLQATRKVIAGSFEPIVYQGVNHDELSELIQAFNKMASELEYRQEQLIQSRKLAAIGTFSSGIAHELNNPLNNISLSADTLLEEFATLSEQEAREIIDDIISQTERATGVVKDLLDFSRDKAPTVEALDIRKVVASTEKLIANELRLNAIWVEDYIPANLPAIMGDMQKLQQVFLNLFVNSIQAMPEGGLITLEGRLEPGYIRVDVSDTGCGIAPENIEHIFDPFYTTKTVGRGTGLGLSIVYGIVKKHGGHLEVKSKVNVGTTFSIFLPVAGPSLTRATEKV